MIFQCLSLGKFEMNIEDYDVLRVILFVYTQPYQHFFQLADACVLAGAVVKEISFYREVQKSDESKRDQNVQAWHILYVETFRFKRHFQLCSFTLLPMQCLDRCQKLSRATTRLEIIKFFIYLKIRYHYKIEKNICGTSVKA